jgi:hypothetical protein
MTPRTWSIAALGLAVLGGTTLHTDYSASRSVHYEAFMEITSETTRMERDGQPMEMPAGAGASGQEREVAWTDKVLEHKDGKPVRVERTFGGVKQTSTMNFGGEEQSREQKGALDSVKPARRGEEGKIGPRSRRDAPAIARRGKPSPLDAFLPEGEVADATSGGKADAIRRGSARPVDGALPARAGTGTGQRRRRSSWPARPARWCRECAVHAGRARRQVQAQGRHRRGRGRRLPRDHDHDRGRRPARGTELRRRQPRSRVRDAEHLDRRDHEIAEGVRRQVELPVSLELEGTTKVDPNRESEGRDGTMMKFGSTQEGYEVHGQHPVE